MSVADSPRESIQPIDKASNTNDLLDIIKWEHDWFETKKESLKQSIIDIVDFYTKKDPTVEKEEGVIFQYSMKGQTDFVKGVFELDLATSAVYKVVIENSISLYTLRSPEETQQNQQQSAQQIVVNPQQKREINLLPRFGTKKVEASLNEYQKPYLKSDDILSEAKQIPQIFQRWNDSHSRDIIWCRKMKGRLEFQERRKTIEFRFFTGTVRPLLNKLIGARSDIIMDKEKKLITEAISNVYRNIERNRNNPMEQMQSQQR